MITTKPQLPKVLWEHIFTFIFPGPNEIQQRIVTISHCCLINKEAKVFFANTQVESLQLCSLKERLILQLKQKYSFWEGEEPPFLLTDALSSGATNLKCSQKKYTEETEKDIRWIVKLVPKSLHSDLGQDFSSYRINMSPLVIACLRPCVSLDIIEFLLKNGADPTHVYYRWLKPIKLSEDIYSFDDKMSVEKIREILKKYIV